MRIFRIKLNYQENDIGDIKTIKKRYYFDSRRLLLLFSLSYRDVSEILNERGISVHPPTIMRLVHDYGYLMYQI